MRFYSVCRKSDSDRSCQNRHWKSDCLTVFTSFGRCEVICLTRNKSIFPHKNQIPVFSLSHGYEWFSIFFLFVLQSFLVVRYFSISSNYRKCSLRFELASVLTFISQTLQPLLSASWHTKQKVQETAWTIILEDAKNKWNPATFIVFCNRCTTTEPAKLTKE